MNALESRRQFLLITEMFDYVRGVDFVKCLIAELRQVGDVANKIHALTRLDIENLPAFLHLLAPDVKTLS